MTPQRATAVRRNPSDADLQRGVEPDGRAASTQPAAPVRAEEQTASGGGDEVPAAVERLQGLPLEVTEVVLTRVAEDLLDGAPLALDDQIVDVQEIAIELVRHDSPDGGLSASHEADEKQRPVLKRHDAV